MHAGVGIVYRSVFALEGNGSEEGMKECETSHHVPGSVPEQLTTNVPCSLHSCP